MKQKPSSRRRRNSNKAILRLPDLEHAKAAVLNSLNSTDAKRGYCHAIDEFVDWYCSEPRLAFNRIVVLRYRSHLESRQLAPGTINLRLGAVRRLAYEAADCGLLSADLADGIRRVKGVKKLGMRLGNSINKPAVGKGMISEKRTYRELAIYRWANRVRRLLPCIGRRCHQEQQRGGPRAARFRKTRRPAPLRGKSPSWLHLQHEARCGSHGIYLPIRANDATLGGYGSVSSVGYMCLRA
jgi:hypothetical protein